MTEQQAAALPVYLGNDLGAACQGNATTFKLWAPTATAVTLRRFATGTDAEPGAKELGRHPLARSWAGVWQLTLPENLAGCYYLYQLTFADGRTVLSADPYANACGAGGQRSMVAELAQAEPAGWQKDARPAIPPEARAVWECHVGDFSADPRSGVPAPWRGKYNAFTLPDTTLDGAGGYPTCLNYLKQLGVSYIQLMPIFDFDRCDETAGTDYNWGYDPLNLRLPEGSYSTDPFHGYTRIRECRAMIAALHRAGLGVVMDVVFNHTYQPDGWLERTVPGYYCRRNPNGTLTNGSGCGSDLASERTMYRKYMVDCCLHWATAYHVDGFRFDLMALHDVNTMNAIRTALDALPGGRSILMYGEPWAGGATCMDRGARPADKGALDELCPRIGFFCDNTRDDIKGNTFDAADPGYANGGPYHGVRLLHALDAWRDGSGGFLPRAAGQVVQYVSAHDNFTLWDKLTYTAHRAPDFTPPCESRLAQNRLAAAIYLTCRGMPFLLAGEEFARTKQGDGNTYRGPQALNQLDWARAERFAALTAYYRGLFAIRRRYPALTGMAGAQPICLLAMPGWCVGFVVEGDAAYRLAVFYNPDQDPHKAELPTGAWRLLCDGRQASATPFGPPVEKQVALPPVSAVLLLQTTE
ncbi:MAG: type I pullulanase [Gemmiger sp.]|nr:type I pullulanase [Gemmiger sp.]